MASPGDPLPPLRALVLAGGAGTRLWPLSTPARPKHLVPGLAPPPRTGRGTLLEATLARIAPLVPFEHVRIVTVRAQAPAVRAVCGLGAKAVVEEPRGRNTAAAVALGVARIARQEPSLDPVIVVLPADHHVADAARFRAHLTVAAAEAVRSRRLGTLGVVPTHPATGYGYLEVASENPAPGTVEDGLRFVEKPSAERAAALLATGRVLWNAGIFVGLRSAFEAQLAAHAAPFLRAATTASPAALDAAYDGLAPLPFDVAVMERLSPGAFFVVPTDAGWSDLGTYRSLFEASGGGPGRTVVTGEPGAKVCLEDAAGNLVHAEGGRTVAVLGLAGLAVVVTETAVLVCPLDRSEDVRRLADPPAPDA